MGYARRAGRVPMLLLMGRSFGWLHYLLIMIRQSPHSAFSRSKQQLPAYLPSSYSRNSGLSVARGGFSYSNNIKPPPQPAHSIAKDIKYLKTNTYQYAQEKDSNPKNSRLQNVQDQMGIERSKDRVGNQFRIKEGKERREEAGSMARTDPYYARTQTPTNTNDARRVTETTYSNVKNDERSYNNAPNDSSRPKTLGLVGLNNIGNTCFMNSILQCMLNLPHFNDYFLSGRHLKQANSGARVAQAYGRLVQLVKTTSARAETPSDIKNAVAMKKPRFSGYAQQDAQEFLAALLELLSLDLNRSRNPKYKELTADLAKHSLDEISEQWWSYYRERENSIVCDYFTGQLLSRVTCSHCRNQSIAFDNSWDFALNFSSSDGGDIHRMLDNFLKEETISSDYYCSRCKTFRECRRKLDFYRLPAILVLQIKRFAFGKYSKQKLNNRVRVSEELDLSRLIQHSKHPSTRNPTYRLVGVVNHSGDINFGHYTADCRNPLNGKWYNFNDSHVSETRLASSFESAAPYLLFYSKLP